MKLFLSLLWFIFLNTGQEGVAADLNRRGLDLQQAQCGTCWLADSEKFFRLLKPSISSKIKTALVQKPFIEISNWSPEELRQLVYACSELAGFCYSSEPQRAKRVVETRGGPVVVI